MNFTELTRRVHAHLGQDHRFEHSVRVARCADLLAQRHAADAARARVAGMLHDLARLYSAADLLAECAARGIPAGDFERVNPIVLHAPLGAALAREEFGIDDGAILSAIEKHTLAAREMSRLDCVLYLADSLEPGRTFAERPDLWKLSMHDLDAGMRETLKASLRYLAQNKLPAAPQTLAAARGFGVEVLEVSLFVN